MKILWRQCVIHALPPAGEFDVTGENLDRAYDKNIINMIILTRALLFVFAIFFLRENCVCYNYKLFHYVQSRGVTMRGKRAQFPWRRIMWGR